MKLTLTRKLYLGFISILLLLLIVGLISQKVLKDTDQQYRSLLDDRVQQVMVIKDLINSQKNQTINIRGYFMYGNEEYVHSFNKEWTNISKYIKELEDAAKTSEEKDQLSKLSKAILENNDNAKRAIEAIKSGDNQKAVSIASSSNELVFFINEAANELIELQTNLMNDTKEAINQKVSAMNRLILLLSIASFLIGGLITVLIGRSITKPIVLVSNTLKEISARNLAIEEVNVKSRDEIGLMVEYLNVMVKDLRGMVTNINDSALEVANQSEELSASSQEAAASSQIMAELAQFNAEGSDRQLEIFNHVTRSMKDMSNTIKEIAISNEDMLCATKEAAIMIKDGSVSVETSTKHMTDLNLAMNQILQIIHSLSQKSKDINKITIIINEIAEQTNMLALNAAIEAARAGEAGRGFSVVAKEVRDLAEQSKDSSKQITEMIESIQEGISDAFHSIEKGSNVVELNLAASNGILKVFSNIKDSASGVGEKVEKVVISTEQINTVVLEILEAVEEVQYVAKQAASTSSEASAATEEQAATTEEIAASAQSLAFLAESLQSSVSSFKL